MALRLVTSGIGVRLLPHDAGLSGDTRRPVAFYSDKHNIFRVNNGEGGDRVTQFGRALTALNIDIICAQQSAGKGPGGTCIRHAARPAW